MGGNLHFGYFDNPDDELTTATCRLIDKMLEYCSINGKSKILDVGCGIGGPALYIHERYKCHITGISTSRRGVDLANNASRQKGFDSSVNFIVADGQKNGLPDKSYDVVWVMESSHMMNKEELFNECFRVLKKGGTMVLCDILLRQPLSFFQEVYLFFKNARDLVASYKTWGLKAVNSTGFYCNGLIKAGFKEIQVLDVSKNAIHTMRHWEKNALSHLGKNIEGPSFGEKDISRFITACRATERFFNEGYLGYTIIKAVKE